MVTVFRQLTSSNIVRSSFFLILLTLLIKSTGYIEKLLLANYFGTSYQVDVYVTVLSIVTSVFLLFREIIEPGFLNIFIDNKMSGNDKIAWAIFNKMFRLIFLSATLLVLLGIAFPNIVISIFAPGFDKHRIDLGVQLIRIALPASVFLALSSLTSITLNGLKIFIIPAFGEVLFKVSIIIGIIFMHGTLGISSAAWGILVGALCRLLIQLLKLFSNLSIKHERIDSKCNKEMWSLSKPLLIGVLFSQIVSHVDNIFASFMQEGSIAALSYAKKIVELPVVLFPYVFSMVLFPYLITFAKANNHEKSNKLLLISLKWLLVIFLPISLFFACFSLPIVELIFKRGAFDDHSVLLTANPLMVYSFGLVFFAIETILVIFFYANSDTKTPVYTGIACAILNIALCWFLIQLVGYVGIALAFVIQKCLKNLILIHLLKRKIAYEYRKLFHFLLNLSIPVIAFGTIVFLARQLVYPMCNDSMLNKLLFISITLLFACAFYVFCIKWRSIKLWGF